MQNNYGMLPRNKRMVASTIAVLIAAIGQNAHADALNFANPDLTGRFDNTVRYNLGVRVENQDSKIMRNSGFDESDGKFGRGDIVTNRLDLLSEFDLAYLRDRAGVRVSAAAWYDHGYRDHSVQANPANGGFASSYINNEYSSTTSRFYNGPSGEILDAFVYGRLDIGKIPLRIKLGKHALYWGESTFFGAHAISYSQSPTDGRKAAANPGTEVKETFLPLTQISFTSSLTSSVSIAGQYMLDWQPNRSAEGGTYFGTSDILAFGPDRRPVNATGLTSPRLDRLEPSSKRGNYGLNLKWSSDVLDSTLGFYYRSFDERQPWTQTLATGYRLVYAQDVQLFGISVGKVVKGISLGGELSYRKNTALNTSAVSTVDNQGARGDTWHALLGATYVVPGNSLFDSASFAGELAYSRLAKVTTHPELFRGIGYGGCVAGQGKWNGCTTTEFVGLAASFTPQWIGVRPAIDLTVPITINYGVKGNGASLAGGNQAALSWSLGLTATIQTAHEISLRYADSVARANDNGTAITNGNGNIGGTDRGWLSLTYKTSF